MSSSRHPHLRRASFAIIAWLLLVVLPLPADALVPGGPTVRVRPVLDQPAEVATALPLERIHLVFPQDPIVTHFDDTWGHRRSGGRRHQGTDLMAPKMSPIYAVADGVVTVKKRGGSAGWWIGIEHAGEIESWYMHLNNDNPGTDDGRAQESDIFAGGLEIGDFVTAGQLIGYVGDSGNAEWTGPHTHFELHVRGVPVDPYDALLAAYERAMKVEALRSMEQLPQSLD